MWAKSGTQTISGYGRKWTVSCDSEEEGNVSRPRLRRLLRVSLRTLLVIVTATCVLLALKVQQVEQQKAAVAWVERMGGSVSYECDKTVDWNRWNLPEQLPGPAWLRELIGVDYFTSVAQVSLYDGVIHDLSPLYELERLKRLVLSPLVQVPDEEIAAFKKALPNCEIFYPCCMTVHGDIGRDLDVVVEEMPGS